MDIYAYYYHYSSSVNFCLSYWTANKIPDLLYKIIGQKCLPLQLKTFQLLRLAVWLSGNALASINVVVLRQTRLVPGWVTVCGHINDLGM